MKRIMYFHLFQSNNPALPVENVDSRISLVTTLGWISRVQLLSLSLSPASSLTSNFDWFLFETCSPSPLNKSRATEGTILNNRYQWR